jgi:FAD/FMN-containing dehydrogenase
MQIKKKLAEVVGEENVFDEPDVLKRYSKDYSLLPSGIPNYVAQPKNAEEIQGIIKIANECLIPVIPCSSEVHFTGSTIPKQGGIVLDLKRMNRIIEVDDKNRKAKIEPGVTWKDFQPALREQNFIMMTPLLPHPRKSVLTSLLEREPLLNTRFEYGDPLLAMQLVFPNGELFRTGTASAPRYPESFAEGAMPQGPGATDFYRLIQCSQGTMGVVAWSNVKIESLPKISKTFFIPFSKVEDAIEPIYRIQKRRIGYECFLIDKLNLATILAEKWPEDFESLQKTFPPWVLILILSAAGRRPEERIEYEEEALREIRKGEFPYMELLTSLPGVPGLERRLPGMLREPWPEEATYWKLRYKGASQDLSFITTLDMSPQFIREVSEIAGRHGFNTGALGHYVQPIEYGVGCHCEFNFYYDPQNPAEVERIKRLYREAAESLLNMGALFTRPYGVLSDIVYSRATSYTMLLKKVKNVFDPNNIMNPGNLCF